MGVVRKATSGESLEGVDLDLTTDGHAVAAVFLRLVERLVRGIDKRFNALFSPEGCDTNRDGDGQLGFAHDLKTVLSTVFLSFSAN